MIDQLTALTVRYLTKRYIGEYDHQTGKNSMKFDEIIIINNNNNNLWQKIDTNTKP